VLENESTPVLYNDPALTARVKATLTKTLGAANVFDAPPVMGSEDVGVFSLGEKIPTCYFRLGAAYPDRYAAAKAAGKELPGPHTSKFEPDPAPTLETGVKVLTAAATDLLR
jgi:metal-dependent amidase/aminoacylase/carboxypeptidase family protein